MNKFNITINRFYFHSFFLLSTLVHNCTYHNFRVNKTRKHNHGIKGNVLLFILFLLATKSYSCYYGLWSSEMCISLLDGCKNPKMFSFTHIFRHVYLIVNESSPIIEKVNANSIIRFKKTNIIGSNTPFG